MCDLNDLAQHSDLNSDELQPLNSADIIDDSTNNESILEPDDPFPNPEDPFPKPDDPLPNPEGPFLGFEDPLPLPDPEPEPPSPIGMNTIKGWDCTSGCAGNCAGSCNWMCQNSAHNTPC